MEHYNTVQVALLGATKSGKTSLARAISGQKFELEYIPTIGSDMFHIYNDDLNLKFLFWDLSGNSRFNTMAESYILISHVVCLCYDSTNYESYQTVRNLYYKFKDVMNKKHICVISTKNDDVLNITLPWGTELSTFLECPMFMTSAVQRKFNDYVEWLNKKGSSIFKIEKGVLDLELPRDGNKRNCCLI